MPLRTCAMAEGHTSWLSTTPQCEFGMTMDEVTPSARASSVSRLAAQAGGAATPENRKSLQAIDPF
eukprot:365578-Chlamydomonas_euryale.AAC.26